ncbi:MAG TPA: protein kinase [Blastocatellia bacterium]|nr:protein kinase [Blastocatellia bacterium]
MISQIVSHYRILNKLGDDKVGEVYLAEDTRLGRLVALKFLPASYQYDPDRHAKLISQTSAAAALRSPHIVSIYDIGEHEDTIFIVMEYVEGDSLSSLIERGPIAPREAVDIILQVADALDEAHRHQIVHGNIRSSVIIVNERGFVKVLDFGLAEIAGRRRNEGDRDRTKKLGQETVIEAMSEEVFYMSPERALGRTVDYRSDIFSLGVVLYEMLAGRVPFEGPTSTETIEKIIHEPTPRLNRLNYSAPLELERIMRKCLEKEADRRYQSARELLIDLKNLKRDSDSGALGYQQASRATTKLRSSPVSRRRKSIARVAVLPLANASDDADAEYLSDGITESLINSLSQLPRLKVMARSTVFRYKSNEYDAQAMGLALEVDAVLVGRVLLRGDNLVISIELVDVADGSRLWGQQYNRQLSDIFAIEEEISSEITESLRLRLTGEEKRRLSKRHTEKTEAYQLYLKGRFHWNKRTEAGLRKGIEFFEQAIDIDPVYALAYAGLADCYTMLSWWNIAAPKEVFPKAKAAAKRALEIDDSLAEAHASMGAVSETDWDWAAAEREYKRALELNANYATAHQWYAEYLAHIGNFDEAIAEIRLAEELDPLSNIINTEVGWLLYLARRYNRAIQQFRATVELDPESAPARWRLGEALLRKQMFDEAIAELERAIEMSGRNLYMLARLGHAYAVAGKRFESLQVINELNDASRERYVAADAVAIIYTGLGETELAFTWLERAYEERSSWLTFLKVEPAYDPLRSDERFNDLLRRIGLPV